MFVPNFKSHVEWQDASTYFRSLPMLKLLPTTTTLIPLNLDDMKKEWITTAFIMWNSFNNKWLNKFAFENLIRVNLVNYNVCYVSKIHEGTYRPWRGRARRKKKNFFFLPALRNYGSFVNWLIHSVFPVYIGRDWGFGEKKTFLFPSLRNYDWFFRFSAFQWRLIKKKKKG